MILSVVVNDQFKIYYAEPFCFKYALPIDSTKICFTLHLIWLGHLNYFSIILNWLWNGIKAKPWNEGWKSVLSFKKVVLLIYENKNEIQKVSIIFEYFSPTLLQKGFPLSILSITSKERAILVTSGYEIARKFKV